MIYVISNVSIEPGREGGGDEWVFQKGGVREIQTPQIWPSVHKQVTWPPIDGVMDEAMLWRYLDT
jgi:hypothetical protein